MKRKKLIGWKRLAAFALALSLTLADGASVAVAGAELPQTESIETTDEIGAAEDTETAEEAEETVETATEEAESTEDITTEEETVTEETETTEEGTEAPAENETEQAEEETEANAEPTELVEESTEKDTKVVEKEEDVKEAQTKPSKVIGLEGNPTWSGTITKASGEILRYSYPNQIPYTQVVAGTADVKDANGNVTTPSSLKDAATGLYKSGDTYYEYCYETDMTGFVRLAQPAFVVAGEPSTYKDAAGLYQVNGKTYRYMNEAPVKGFSYVDADEELIAVGTADTVAEADALEQSCAVKDTDDSILYYTVAGKVYESLGRTAYFYDAQGNRKYFVYAEAANEISFDKFRVNLSWNRITDSTVLVNAAGDKLNVGYEVVVNDDTSLYGQYSVYDTSAIFLDPADNSLHNMTTGNSKIAPYIVVGAGETVNVKVRAVYYHRAETILDTDDSENVIWQDKYTNCVVDMYGEWSDVYTYTGQSLKVAPAVTGVAATATAEEIQITWNNSEIANYQRLYYIASTSQLNITDAAAFKQFYYGEGDLYNAYVAAKGQDDYIYTDYEGTYDNYYTISGNKGTPYYYFAVVVSSAADGYITDGTYSNIAAAVFSNAANTPAVKNFKVEKTGNGNGWQLSWTPVEADMIIYAFEGGKQPAYYNYGLLNAYGYYTDADGNKETVYLEDELTDGQQAEISKYVRSAKVNGESGTYSGFSLKPGVKYTFAAYTYDDDSAVNKVEKPALTTVNHEVAVYTTDANGNENRTITTVAVPMTYYTAIGTAATASYTGKITKPSVTTSTTKTSIKLSMSASNYTGFEIYRLSGKKYKKIATTTDSSYTDSDLKEGTKYSYKVRAYYYDTETKAKSYSEYKALSATTSAVNNITLKAVKASKTSVKLTWKKVSAATKYEIYRSSETSKDPSVVCRQLNSGNSAAALSNAKYELVKTVKKAATVTYTDKSLKAGETYSYIVMAYYTSGKKTAYISAGDTIALELETPANVTAINKGTKVTVKWDADKYASKYELKYKVYNKYGKAKTNTWKTASTKKTSYTISGLANGEYVDVQVRAYGSNKTYSGWSAATVTKSLAAASGIKASNVAKTGAVKVTWKKVSGAKYYKVYRSTSMATYNSDDKRYAAKGDLIAKESNDDTGNYSEVYYDQYYGVEGSVTGTTAYDYAQLKSGVTYYYTVVAFGEKDSEIAAYTTVGTTEYVASGKPASVVYGVSEKITSLKNSKKGQVTVKYDKVTGAKNYYVYRATKKNGTYTLVGSTTKTTFTDKKATKGKTYYYKVVVKGTNVLKADFTVESAAKSVKVTK